MVDDGEFAGQRPSIDVVTDESPHSAASLGAGQRQQHLEHRRDPLIVRHAGEILVQRERRVIACDRCAPLQPPEILDWQLDGRKPFELDETDIEAVRRRCVFTTHTPVPAGHDKFPLDMVRMVLGDDQVALLDAAHCLDEGTLNLTHVALRLARFVNGVAMKHREVSQGMFPNFPIDAITNGVHAGTWTSPAFQSLFDKRIPEWRTDNLYLRYAVGIPLPEIRAAHAEAKRAMIAAVAERTGVSLDPKVFTIGFAHFYLREPIRWSEVAGLILVAVGVMLALLATF